MGNTIKIASNERENIERWVFVYFTSKIGIFHVNCDFFFECESTQHAGISRLLNAFCVDINSAGIVHVAPFTNDSIACVKLLYIGANVNYVAAG